MMDAILSRLTSNNFLISIFAILTYKHIIGNKGVRLRDFDFMNQNA